MSQRKYFADNVDKVIHGLRRVNVPNRLSLDTDGVAGGEYDTAVAYIQRKMAVGALGKWSRGILCCALEAGGFTKGGIDITDNAAITEAFAKCKEAGKPQPLPPTLGETLEQEGFLTGG